MSRAAVFQTVAMLLAMGAVIMAGLAVSRQRTDRANTEFLRGTIADREAEIAALKATNSELRQRVYVVETVLLGRLPSHDEQPTEHQQPSGPPGGPERASGRSDRP